MVTEPWASAGALTVLRPRATVVTWRSLEPWAVGVSLVMGLMKLMVVEMEVSSSLTSTSVMQ